MPPCAVKFCPNESKNIKKCDNVSYHRFPMDPVVADYWTKQMRINRRNERWKPSNNSRICSAHFNDTFKYLTKKGICKLLPNAVPTKNLGIDSENDIEAQLQHSDMSHDKEGHKTYMKYSDEQNAKPSTSRVVTPPNEVITEFLDFNTPRKVLLRRQLRKKTLMQIEHTKRIKALKKQNQRLKRKNASLKQVLVELKKQRYISNDVSNLLSENLFAAELYNSLVQKNRGKKRPLLKYPPEFRKFCLTLHFYSPRAYDYVREIFNTCLPHKKTIYNWYRSVGGDPGFTDEAFTFLKSKSDCSTKKLVCVLIADEMAIRPQNIKGGHGQVNIGIGTTECNTIASEAYVFLLVCLNEHWKIPLGYFLIHSLSGDQKANLINICLSKCEEVGIKVVALTFDGHATNISTMELLGCQIKDSTRLKTTFKHPSANHNVAVFLDFSHMIKLVRNHFESKQVFLDPDHQEVNWQYLVKLNLLQEKEGMHLANKLTRKHLEFRNSIMKVKLATQLLSRSVALSLKFCRQAEASLGLNDFSNSESTERFVLLFNDLFDIFNSRKLTQHGFARPLNPKNKDEIFTFLEIAKQYIINLQIKTTRKRTYKENGNSVLLKIKSFEPVLNTNCYTGFKGILICIESLQYLYKTLVEDTKEMNYITTYRLSQDHLELLFGVIRMHGGHNDNPNALQFKGIYRKLFCRMELKVGETGNCVPVENISILTCCSAINCINSTTLSARFDEAADELNFESVQDDLDIHFSSAVDDPDLKNHIVGYIAGNVVKFISKRLKCHFCLANMLASEKQWFHKLVCLRDQGGLVYASKEVYSICSVAETCLRNYIRQSMHTHANSEKVISLQVMKKLVGMPLFPIELSHVNSEHHVTNLTRLIVDRYIKIRLYYENKKDNIKKTVFSKRQLFRKQIQFQGT